MLKGWTAEKTLADLQAGGEDYDLTTLAPKLKGKSVLLIAGDKDASVPPDMVEAVAKAYGEEPEIDLTMSVLSGDHSFSWSRMALSEDVLDWVDACR